MDKAWKRFIVFSSVLLLSAALRVYNFYEPVRHFDSDLIPPLVSPRVMEKENNEGAEAADENEVGMKSVFKEGKSVNILILGIDARKKEESRTDAIMLASLNPDCKSVTIISIPRDTRVNVEGVGQTKINHAHLMGEIKGGNNSGTQASLQAVSNLFQCNIHYYFKTNFDGFEQFIDSIGGLEVNLALPVLLTHSDITLSAGKQCLDGDLALQLVRERHSLKEGDFGRQRHQVLVLQAIARKLLKLQYMLRLPEIFEHAKSHIIDTNLQSNDIISLAWLYSGLKEEDINHLSLPGKSGYGFDPLVKNALYYWLPDLEKVKEISVQYLQ